ncbi:MAG: LTA synthase family protein [Eubacterium sp.]|nr:LTA synthase family protein [Eubacterium sp.]
MFLTLATIAAAICAVSEIIFYHKKRTAGYIITSVLRNVLLTDTLTMFVFLHVLRCRHFLDCSMYKPNHYVKVFFVALGVGFLSQALYSFLTSRLRIEPDEPKHKKGAMVVRIVSTILFFLGCMAKTGTDWGRNEFGKVTGDQLIINLTSPTEGTEASVYYSGFEGPVFHSLLYTMLFALFVFVCFKLVCIFKNEKTRTVLNDLSKRIVCAVLAVFCLVQGVSYGIDKFKLETVFNAYVLKSDIIDKNYVDPRTAEIKWPEKKRNLIHIYLESMENSYMSKAEGGFMKDNLIPNLTKLAYTGTVFSNNGKYFGGPREGTGTQWSVASMVNQLTGLPMKAPGWINSYGADGKFLSGAYTLGELLEEQGYEQTCMIGASGTFGGLRYLYTTHGNWTFFDYNYAIEHKYIPENYKVWWGFEDDKLYEFAKKEITRLYETGKPFNFTMENADTHRPDGYVSPGKSTPFKLPYANAIWNSDKDVSKFIEWIQQQPFYENTTIVLIGDHLSMDTAFFRDAKFTKKYNRTQYNCIINPDPSVGKPDERVTRKRKWANWDYFPTIVASIGGQIEGERLGIGTNLFSGHPTIYEELGAKEVDKELEKGSVFYNERILQVSELDSAASKGIKTKKKHN